MVPKHPHNAQKLWVTPLENEVTRVAIDYRENIRQYFGIASSHRVDVGHTAVLAKQNLIELSIHLVYSWFSFGCVLVSDLLPIHNTYVVLLDADQLLKSSP